MSLFDWTTLQLILDGDKTAATAALDLGQPDEFIETIGSAAEYATLAYQATSPTSNSIFTSGTKQWTLTAPRYWKAGTPVRILATGFEANFMDGVLDSDEASGVISVTITSGTGTGTYTSWTILVLSSATTVASPPLGIVDGGTAGTTTPTARDGIEVHRWLDVVGRQAVPPGSPGMGTVYIVGQNGTGDWAFKDDDFAFWNGSWTYETPLKGDSASVNSDLDIPSGATSFLIFDGTEWLVASNHSEVNFGHPGVSTMTAADLPHPENFFSLYYAASADDTITLLNGAAADNKIATFKVDTRHAYNLILNVAGGETIDAASSLTLTPGDSCRLLYHVTESRWYILSHYVA